MNIEWKDGMNCAVITGNEVRQCRDEFEAGLIRVVYITNGKDAEIVLRSPAHDQLVKLKQMYSEYRLENPGSSITLEYFTKRFDKVVAERASCDHIEMLNTKLNALKRLCDELAVICTKQRYKIDTLKENNGALKRSNALSNVNLRKINASQRDKCNELYTRSLKLEMELAKINKNEYWNGTDALRVGHIVEHGATVEAIKNGIAVVYSDGFKMAAVADIRTTPIVDWDKVPLNIFEMYLISGAYVHSTVTLNNATLPCTVKRPL